ncbi:MAG: hypothetical protein ABIF82_09900 [Planctomycetota bacterium]
MDETYHVVAREELTGPLQPIAGAIATATGKVVLDVTREIRGKIGILASGLAKDQADAAISILGHAGVRAFALPESDVVRFPDPVFLETARLGDDALEVSDLRDKHGRRIGQVNVPYADIVFIAAAHVRTEAKKRVVESQPGLHAIPPVPGVGLAGALAAALPALGAGERTFHMASKSDYDHFLDIFAIEPAHHLRLNASKFNFTQTGMKLQPTSIANLTRFIKHFVVRCDHALIDASIRHILDGSPQTNLTFNHPAQYDAYLSWRVQLLYNPE